MFFEEPKEEFGQREDADDNADEEGGEELQIYVFGELGEAEFE